MEHSELLRTAITRVVGTSDFPFNKETHIMNDIGLDSTSSMEVLMELEDMSTLEVDPNDLCIDDFETVGAFLGFLDRSLGA